MSWLQCSTACHQQCVVSFIAVPYTLNCTMQAIESIISNMAKEMEEAAGDAGSAQVENAVQSNTAPDAATGASQPNGLHGAAAGDFEASKRQPASEGVLHINGKDQGSNSAANQQQSAAADGCMPSPASESVTSQPHISLMLSVTEGSGVRCTLQQYQIEESSPSSRQQKAHELLALEPTDSNISASPKGTSRPLEGSNKPAAKASKQAAELHKRSKVVGRNQQCPCGSHKKYKACCGRQQKGKAASAGAENAQDRRQELPHMATLYV